MIGRATLSALVVAVLLFLALPIVIIIILSFSSATYLTFPPPAFGVRWYRAYLGGDEWLAATALICWSRSLSSFCHRVGHARRTGPGAPAAPVAQPRRGVDCIAADRAGDHCAHRRLR